MAYPERLSNGQAIHEASVSLFRCQCVTKMTSRSERDPPFFPRLQRTDFEEELRKRLAKVAHRYTVRLTHYGRKTGMPHQVTI